MSDISFSKLTWENLPARTTALSATNLNRIENGINDSVNGVNSNSHSIAELQTRISQIANGYPTPVATVAEMTDESAVYLYTGSESGYTAGNWYYYNGTAWTSGGTYGGAVTDTTLSISGAAADAKAVGDALALKADDSDVSALDTRVTALESGSSGGLTADIKSALLACFAKVAWIDEDGQDYYDALDLALNPPANLSSITAVYTQSGTVYDTDSLDSLMSDLVVTAHYSDNTTATVTNYTLSGTLTEGTSTITVSYGGKTTTFTVTVTSLMETITVTWSGTGTGKQTGVIDARTADVYWTLPFIEGDSAYASGVTWESDFVGIGASLYNDSTAETAVGYYYFDTEQIESSARTSVNRPSMPCNTQIKVAPHGYYVKLFGAIRSGFTSNSAGLTFLNTYANTVNLLGTGA